MGQGLSLHYRPEITPDNLKESAFDDKHGFKSPRTERVMIATEEQMVSAKLLLEERDFCAHKLIDYKACRSDTFPWIYKCAPERHEYLNCQYEDYVIRMKEYERERRLMERQVRIEKKQGLAA